MRGITILLGAKSVHTGDDYDLVQEQKTIGLPTLQSYTIEVPGRNGLVNLTKGLTGRVNYLNRELSFQFFATGNRVDLQELLDTFCLYHGETIQIIDDDTPDFYYEGECSVGYTWGPNYLTINLTINANPFRVALATTVVNINLKTTDQSVFISNPGVAVSPTIIVSNTAKIVKGDLTYNLTTGTYNLSDIELDTGNNELIVSGSGTVELTYKEARL